MSMRALALTATAFILACSSVGVVAQERTTPQPDQQQVQSPPASQQGAGMMGQHGMMGQGSMAGQGGMMGHDMMSHDMMGGHMMGRGMMGGGATEAPIMMRMMFALMDADGDGTISLQEFQAAHERIFKAMDANKDGVLTMEEIDAFMHGK